jgi:hypothetical protein
MSIKSSLVSRPLSRLQRPSKGTDDPLKMALDSRPVCERCHARPADSILGRSLHRGTYLCAPCLDIVEGGQQ